MSRIIIIGNTEMGFAAYGPFEDSNEAFAYGEKAGSTKIDGKRAETMALNAPLPRFMAPQDNPTIDWRKGDDHLSSGRAQEGYMMDRDGCTILRHYAIKKRNATYSLEFRDWDEGSYEWSRWEEISPRKDTVHESMCCGETHRRDNPIT